MTKEEFNEKWRNIVIHVDGPIDIKIVNKFLIIKECCISN